MAAPAIEHHVLIIGAGATGLLLAHGLAKADIPYTIFELEPSASHYRPREWSMGIHWALPLLESLLPTDLYPRLKDAFNDPFFEDQQTSLLLYNGLEGNILKEIPIPRTVRVSRRKFRKFLAQGIDVTYGYEIEDIQYGDGGAVTAVFKNGKKVTGTIVVGADGPRSKVRQLLLGDKGDVTPLDAIHANVALCYNDAEKAKFIRTAHPVFSICVHPEVFLFMSIQDVPDPSDPANWCFQVVTSWKGKSSDTTSMDNKARLAQVKQKASLLNYEPFKNAVLWMPDDTVVTYDTIAYWIPIPWDNHTGRVTLAGDAAHPMAPHRGQGLNHAICDAANFVKGISRLKIGTGGNEEVGLAEMIQEYDKEVVKRGSEEVKTSKLNADMMLDWDLIMQSPIVKGGLTKV